jgi:hypothetical protein
LPDFDTDTEREDHRRDMEHLSIPQTFEDWKDAIAKMRRAVDLWDRLRTCAADAKAAKSLQEIVDGQLSELRVVVRQWPQVDFEGGAVFVTQSLEETKEGFRLKAPKTNAGKRRIALAPKTMASLNGHRRHMLAEGRDVKLGPVFVDTDGGFFAEEQPTPRKCIVCFVLP